MQIPTRSAPKNAISTASCQLSHPPVATARTSGPFRFRISKISRRANGLHHGPDMHVSDTCCCRWITDCFGFQMSTGANANRFALDPTATAPAR